MLLAQHSVGAIEEKQGKSRIFFSEEVKIPSRGLSRGGRLLDPSWLRTLWFVSLNISAFIQNPRKIGCKLYRELLGFLQLE
jgi:hypothetical protein